MINRPGLQEGREELLEMLQVIRDTIQDLSPCGPSVLSLLDRIFSLLRDTNPTDTSTRDASTLASSLLRLSNEKLNSFPYRQVPLSWRRLYTDSTLLNSISQLLHSEVKDEGLLEVIRELDMALIVAGAPGIDRSDLIFRLVSIAQSRLSLTEEPEDRPRKRRRPNSPTSRIPPPYVARPLPVLDSLPDFLLPSSELSHTRPFVARHAASDWTAIEKWKDIEYLRGIGGGRGRVVPVEVGNDYTKEGWGQRIISWDTFLESMFHSAEEEDEEEEEEESYYLAQHSLLNQFPALARDFPIPSLVYSEPPALEEHYSEYQAPQNEDRWIVNAWLGGGGTVSQAHTDPFWNCYIQAVGSKWVWIAPPSVSPHMATFGGPSEGAKEDTPDQEGGSSSTTGIMTNTSTIDVTRPLSPPSVATPSTNEVPPYSSSYLNHVEPVAQQIVLEAGDVLVMPPGWWHAMKSLETSFSISIWF